MSFKTTTLLSDELYDSFHPTLNSGVDLNAVAAMSNKKYWWVCEVGHTHKATAAHKTKGLKCPVCNGKQILEGFNDFASQYPDLTVQWHQTLNNVKPNEITRGYNKKVWWSCSKGHSYETKPYNRTIGTGCPVCSNRVVLEGVNDLATTHPEIAAQWHPTRNGILTPQQISSGYAKKVWMLCVQENHQVEVLIANCLLGNRIINCLYCSGKKVLPGFNDIATTNPEMVKYWHPTKNGSLLPSQVTKGSKDKIWWTCDSGHDYELLPNNRVITGDRCSFCDGNRLVVGVNDLATTHPNLAEEWDFNKNGNLNPETITRSSNKKVYWTCSKCTYNWSSTIHNRSRSSAVKSRGCPVCSGFTVLVGTNDLSTTHPQIASEFDTELNKSLSVFQLTAGMSREIWWRCHNLHTYIATVRSRTSRATGCVQCYRAGLPSNAVSLEQSHPLLAAEWDYNKNDNKTPLTTAAYSNKRVWWICSKNDDHSWETVVSNRTRFNSGCPTCWKKQIQSGPEKEIFNFLTKLGETVECNTRKYLNGQELDLCLPKHKFAIEYNGIYWHSEAAGKDKNYHHDKFVEAQKVGITLFQIWEDDWLNKKDIIIRHIAYQINKIKELQELFPEMDKEHFHTSYARTTQVVEITYQQSIPFLTETHVQGPVKGTHYYALKNKQGNLCAVMVLAKTSKTSEYLLARYATKGIVPGGFTKLLKHAVSASNAEKIITFADRTISNGRLYEKTGFTKDSELKPDYMYVKNKKKFHKFGFRLKAFKNRNDLIYVENMTEKELAELNGYSRIWDAGKTKYVLDVTKM